MTHLFEMSVTDREDAIYTKDELLVEPDGTPNHPQGPSKLFDFDELRIGDGWMRATSPSGQAAYEGVVAWTPSARTGSLPAERGQSSPNDALPESDTTPVASVVDDAEVSLEEGATDG
jgi:NADH-quinone oxidoreductase subunit I